MKGQRFKRKKILFFEFLDYIVYRFSRQKKDKLRLLLERLIVFIGVVICFFGGLKATLWAQENRSLVSASSPLHLSAFAQVRYTAFSSDGIDSFSLRRVRLAMNANVLMGLDLKMQIELTKSPNLLEAYLSYHPRNWLEFRAGQFKIPFSYENLKSASEQEFINRSSVVEVLCPGRDIGAQGRDIGAMFLLKLSFFEASFGVFNGSGINRLDNDQAKDKAFRVVISPWSSLKLGGSWYEGRWPQPVNSSQRRSREGFEIIWQLDNFYLAAELIKSFNYHQEAKGWVAQAGLFLSQRRIQPLVRYEFLDRDISQSTDDEEILTLGLNWYLGPRTKIQINQEMHQEKLENKKRKVSLLQFQIGF